MTLASVKFVTSTTDHLSLSADRKLRRDCCFRAHTDRMDVQGRGMAFATVDGWAYFGLDHMTLIAIQSDVPVV
jgi:hypothetical protein